MKKIFNALYLVLILIIIISYAIMDFSDEYDSSYFKYVLVILVLIYVFYNAIEYIINKKNIIINILYMLAISFTLISDWFLLILDKYYLIALIPFIIAHSCYSLLIYYSSKNRNLLRFFIEKIVIIILGVIVLIILKDIIGLLIGIYAGCLIFNFVDGLLLYIKTKEYYAMLLLIGFVLFIGCDICVALSDLYLVFDETDKIIEIEVIASNLIWVFYGPSQYFLSLSINRGGNK